MPTSARRPAGLWVRARAFAFDYVPIASYLAILIAAGSLLNRYFEPAARALFGNPVAGEASGFLLITLPVSMYFALLEASSRQATWGKGRLGLRVTDLQGRRLSVPHSLGRTALKFAPWELAHACIWKILFADNPSSALYVLGFTTVWAFVGANILSVYLSPTRQALYDRLARTVVTRGA